MQAADRLRELGLTLSPTFMAFTPWTTTSTYLEMLSVIGELNLIDHVAPIQYAIRLLIPPGSRLMELREIQDIVEPYDHSALYYPWQNPDPEIDQLYERVYRLVHQNQKDGQSRSLLFANIWQAVLDTDPTLESTFPKENIWDLAAMPVPHLSESWY